MTGCAPRIGELAARPDTPGTAPSASPSPRPSPGRRRTASTDAEGQGCPQAIAPATRSALTGPCLGPRTAAHRRRGLLASRFRASDGPLSTLGHGAGGTRVGCHSRGALRSIRGSTAASTLTRARLADIPSRRGRRQSGQDRIQPLPAAAIGPGSCAVAAGDGAGAGQDPLGVGVLGNAHAIVHTRPEQASYLRARGANALSPEPVVPVRAVVLRDGCLPLVGSKAGQQGDFRLIRRTALERRVDVREADGMPTELARRAEHRAEQAWPPRYAVLSAADLTSSCLPTFCPGWLPRQGCRAWVARRRSSRWLRPLSPLSVEATSASVYPARLDRGETPLVGASKTD
jgi:hypothetical protein